MKKFFLSLAIMSLLLSCSVSFASVGVRLNGTPMGQATDINFICGSGTNGAITADGSIYNIGCSAALAAAGTANGGATSMTTIQLAVPVSYTYVRKAIAALASGPFQAGTMAAGIPGQIITVFITEVGTSGTYTITPTVSTGWATIKFTAAKDTATFLYVDDTAGWVILSSGGSVTVTQP